MRSTHADPCGQWCFLGPLPRQRNECGPRDALGIKFRVPLRKGERIRESAIETRERDIIKHFTE